MEVGKERESEREGCEGGMPSKHSHTPSPFNCLYSHAYLHPHTLIPSHSHPHKDDEKARREALEKKLEDDKLKSKKKKKRLM